jgi:hypothetical protein
LIEVDWLVPGEFFPIKTHIKMVSPILAPLDPLEALIFTKLNLHHVRRLSCKSELF